MGPVGFLRQSTSGLDPAPHPRFVAQVLLGVLYTAQKSVLVVLGFVGGVEAVGYPDLAPSVLLARRDPFDKQLHELSALPERLFGVLFDFSYTFPERDKPCGGCFGQLCLLALLGEVGLEGLYQESQVVRLILEVG